MPSTVPVQREHAGGDFLSRNAIALITTVATGLVFAGRAFVFAEGDVEAFQATVRAISVLEAASILAFAVLIATTMLLMGGAGFTLHWVVDRGLPPSSSQSDPAGEPSLRTAAQRRATVIGVAAVVLLCIPVGAFTVARVVEAVTANESTHWSLPVLGAALFYGWLWSRFRGKNPALSASELLDVMMDHVSRWLGIGGLLTLIVVPIATLWHQAWTSERVFLTLLAVCCSVTAIAGFVLFAYRKYTRHSAVLGILLAVILSWAYPLFTLEVVSTTDGGAVVGYVVEDEGEWITIIRQQDRQVVVLETSDVEDRASKKSFCESDAVRTATIRCADSDAVDEQATR